MYTAVVLTQESRDLLKKVYKDILTDLLSKGFVPHNAQGQPLLHHVTINIGDLNEDYNPRSLIGREVIMDVVTFGSDYRAAAFGIDYRKSGNESMFGQPLVCTMNKVPHITAAVNLKEGGKPFHSNDIKVWEKLPKAVEIRGVVQIVN